MTKTEKKNLAQELIIDHLASIGYGRFFEEYCEQIGNIDEANQILFEQMQRVAKMFNRNAYTA